jgi:hypothetical protein
MTSLSPLHLIIVFTEPGDRHNAADRHHQSHRHRRTIADSQAKVSSSPFCSRPFESNSVD